MSAGAVTPPRLGATARTDRWWAAPVATAVGLGAFGIYSIVVAAMGTDYLYTGGGARYLSPFYSPDLKSFGLHISFTYAFFVVWVPLGFRTTCYYYRKAYYRSFWLSPPACAVAEPHKKYSGEARFPLLIQNIHRYTWYFAVFFASVLTYDAFSAFFYSADGTTHFFVGVGSFVLLANAVLILGYTFGCHSCRHITAGRINNFSKHPLRFKWWGFVSKLNKHHIRWAWASLIWIAVTDGYIRLVANGTLHDYHHIF
jgi:hypothetical protein